jgi:putative peptidoglycan lipid II flippase
VTFQARGDTTTPVKALFVAVIVNVALKILLMDRFAQVGLAFATSIGAWVNFALLLWFATRQNLISIDARLRASLGKLAIAGVVLAAALYFGNLLLGRVTTAWPFRDELTLAALALIGLVVYAGALAILFGRQLKAFVRGGSKPAAPPTDQQN